MSSASTTPSTTPWPTELRLQKDCKTLLAGATHAQIFRRQRETLAAVERYLWKARRRATLQRQRSRQRIFKFASDPIG
jgi:hypothetical protein